MDELLDVNQVADKLYISPFMVRKLLRTGQLRGFKIGKLWRVEESEIERFVEELKGGTARED